MSAPLGFRGQQGAGVPGMPTPPTGFAIAAYPQYSQASHAVEYLGKNDFTLHDVTIVGSDLQLVERVTGKLTARRLAGAGAASGAWMGLFVGLMMSFFAQVNSMFTMIIVTIGIGAIFGAIMGALGSRVTKNKRDFTSASQVVARRYDVLCEPRTAEKARTLLAQMQMGHTAS